MCGNELEAFVTKCPFCGTKNSAPTALPRGPKHRTVNLEKGMPLVEQALHRMRAELQTSRMMGCRVVTFIHGYGSSGTGGAIRREVRLQLDYMLTKHEIKEVLPGELFLKKHGQCRQLLSRFPFLTRHVDYNRANPGVTLVVL